MKVLITGISGLIGRWTALRLANAGHHVVGLDLLALPEGVAAAEHYRCDLLDKSRLIRVLRDEAPEAIAHLAARTGIYDAADLEGYAANSEGVRNLIGAITETPSVRRVVYTSSQLVCRVGYMPRTDQDYCPQTVYGQSKVLTEQIVRQTNGGGVEWCIVRPTTVWGPWMHPHYRTMLRMIQRGRYFHCGNAKLYKSYSYVENIAWQYLQLLTAPVDAIHSRLFYLADYKPLSLRDYVDALAREMGAPRIPTYPLTMVKLLALGGDVLTRCGFKRFPFSTFRLQNILTEYVFDLAPTERVCGPLPFGWEQGVKQTANWFKALRT
jgi:GlcNAc-P-P-Und epimerase